MAATSSTSVAGSGSVGAEIQYRRRRLPPLVKPLLPGLQGENRRCSDVLSCQYLRVIPFHPIPSHSMPPAMPRPDASAASARPPSSGTCRAITMQRLEEWASDKASTGAALGHSLMSLQLSACPLQATQQAYKHNITRKRNFQIT